MKWQTDRDYGKRNQAETLKCSPFFQIHYIEFISAISVPKVL
jgi:hypothetical protein